jgi:hypothetical protein
MLVKLLNKQLRQWKWRGERAKIDISSNPPFLPRPNVSQRVSQSVSNVSQNSLQLLFDDDDDTDVDEGAGRAKIPPPSVGVINDQSFAFHPIDGGTLQSN